MGEVYVQIAAIISAALLVAIAIFQLLLFLGLPLAEYSWGGKYRGVLPPAVRMMSLISAIVLLFMGLVFLVHTKVFFIGMTILPTHILVWVFTIFLGLNTLGNLVSKSKKEKMVMSPLSGVTFVACLVVSIFNV